CLQHKNFPLTF
nr:immunoglobulin light chain junction region [Macaca mulatta]